MIKKKLKKISQVRSGFFTCFTFALFLILFGKSIELQIIKSERLQAEGDSRFLRTKVIGAYRGTIYDRAGKPLAVSSPVNSVCIHPVQVDMTYMQKKELADLLKIKLIKIQNSISKKERKCVYLKRHISPSVAIKLTNLDYKGIFLEREYKRFYPEKEVASHLIGMTDIDEKGQEGLEKTFQNWLQSKNGRERVIQDARKKIVKGVKILSSPMHGKNLVLSVDSRIQHIAYKIIKKGVIENSAKSGSIVVLDAKLGEVLALANFPSYNPNNRAVFNAEKVRNTAIVDMFEPGSTLKPFTIAAAIDSKLVTENHEIDIGLGSLKVGNTTIRDTKFTKNILTVTDILKTSSNVGSAKIALLMEPKKLWSMYRRVGYGKKPQTGFPGETRGRLRSYVNWKPIEHVTMSYGHGMSVSLLQLARSYTIFSNKGRLLPVTFERISTSPSGEKVISVKTADRVLKILEEVTQVGGTATKAKVSGYRVAGKTGTSQKVINGKYSNELYIASFVGIAPVSKPKIIVAIMIDEPKSKSIYASKVAAPLFSDVVSRTLRFLKVPYDKVEDFVVKRKSFTESDV